MQAEFWTLGGPMTCSNPCHDSVQVCTTDVEVDAALRAWAAFGTPGAPDPAAALPPNPLARLWGGALATSAGPPATLTSPACSC